MQKKPSNRDHVISLKLTAAEKRLLDSYSSRYGLPASTCAYLMVKDSLHRYEQSYRLGLNLELL